MKNILRPYVFIVEQLTDIRCQSSDLTQLAIIEECKVNGLKWKSESLSFYVFSYVSRDSTVTKAAFFTRSLISKL